MRRLAFLIAFLAAPAPAAAAPLGELPFEPMPKRGAATCLQPTGAPGELALARPRSVDFLAADPGGTARGPSVHLGRLGFACPAAATAPGGAAVAAGVIARRPWRNPFATEVRAAARDAGGEFVPSIRLAGGGFYSTVSAAVSQSGHAVVAWTQIDGFLSRRQRVRIMAARRAAGGRFGPVEPLTPWHDAGRFGEPAVATAVDGSGTATVAWLRPLPARGAGTPGSAVETATAPPGRAFAVQRVAGSQAEHLALAVAPDGWALLAHGGLDELSVLERPPGAARFAEAFATSPERGAATPAVAVRNGGGGLVAWRTSPPGDRAGVMAATRAAPGRFGRPRTVAPETDRSLLGELLLVALSSGGLYDVDEPLRAALAPDGRAMLSWTSRRAPGVASPHLARGTLADGFGAPVRLGSRVRDANGVSPLYLADGHEAVAWTDNGGEYEARDGRLHLAVESAPTPRQAAPPKVTLRSARTQRLFASQPLDVVVACDRPCDVRAALPGRPVAVSATRLRAGRVRLQLASDDRPHRGVERVVVRATALNGRRVTTATQRIRVVPRPALPVPRPVAVRARRRGDSIVVTWRTARPARRTVFGVEGRRNRRRGRELPDFRSIGSRFGRGRTEFQVRLRPLRPRRVRWVAVHATSRDAPRRRHVVIVRVSGGRSSASG